MTERRRLRLWAAACAAAATTAAAAPARAVPPEPTRASASGPAPLLLGAGASYRRVFDIPYYGARLELGVGRLDDDGADHAHAAFLVGRTAAGLETRELRLGYRTDWTVDRFRLGGIVGVGFVTFERVTSADTITTGGTAATLLAGWELLPPGGASLLMQTSYDVLVSSPWIHGATLGLTLIP